jgi:signal peptidase I
MSVATQKSGANSGGLGETVKIVIQALILALVVRTLLFQPFNIPSGSMKSTLLVGDYIFVSKYSYGYSRYSLPFGVPLFHGRIWSAPPERGDIAVFKLPRDDSTDYIKRVIGLPGDRIQMKDGVLYINDAAVKRERVDDWVTTDGEGREQRVARYQETLPNGVSYLTLDLDPNGFEDNTDVYEVPPDHYFMMGDNRDNSTDSRVPPTSGGVGFVPFENFVGRAEIIFFSVEEGKHAWAFWEWPWSARWDRVLKAL